MSATNFHVTEDGPMPCEAQSYDSCPIKGEHFDNFDDAQTMFEMQMEDIYSNTTGLSKPDPYASYSRYGLNGADVPLDLIEPESIDVEYLEEGIVLHHIGFAEDADEEQQALYADDLGLDIDDELSMFRVYSKYDDLRIGSVIRRQHGIEVAGQRFYAPESFEFVVRTGQDLFSLENKVASEQDNFENELREHGLRNTDDDFSRPEPSSTPDDNILVSKALNKAFKVRELREVTIHNDSYATHHFDIMTKNEKSRHRFKPESTVYLFADYRSAGDTMSVSMGVEIDGKKRYQADPQGQPIVHDYTVEDPAMVEKYIQNAKSGAASKFRRDMNSTGLMNFVSQYDYDNRMGFLDDEE